MAPKITLDALKRLAEKADGLRLTDLVLAWDTAANRAEIAREADATASGWTILAEIDASTARPFAARPVLSLTPSPVVTTESGAPLPAIDAWFLTAAAVEKFVVPYYTKVRDAAYAQHLRDRFFDDPSLLALFHEPDSETGFAVE